MSDERLWEDLLFAIEDRQVVPIVGDQLLTIDTPEGPRLFLEVVAEFLAKELRVSAEVLPAHYLPNDVVCASSEFHGDPEDISLRVAQIVRSMKPSVPEPLRLLAEITDFELFISTSFDTLLEDAIASARKKRPAVVAFPPANYLTDFDEELLTRDGALVYQILGRASVSASFAVTEGQMLEQMHHLMEGAGRPKALITKLQKSHLLVLGVSLPDWLSRFLLRLSREKPLWDSRTRMEVIVGGSKSAEEFGDFMRHFSPTRTRVVSVETPAAFVKELHRRWFARHPAGGLKGTALPDVDQPSAMAAGSIFVSYASEDREEAFRLADDLSSAGLEVWVDRSLKPGDEYRKVIERHIRDCGAFVPVISRHTQTDEERWFRREWAAAYDRARSYFGLNRSLMFPVVVDDTPFDALETLETEIFGRNAVRALGGIPTTDLIATLDAAQKGSRSRAARP